MLNDARSKLFFVDKRFNSVQNATYLSIYILSLAVMFLILNKLDSILDRIERMKYISEN